MNEHIREIIAEAVLDLALIIKDPDDQEIRRAQRMRSAAERALTMCAGDAITAITIAASLVDVDGAIQPWHLSDPNWSTIHSAEPRKDVPR
ncbi:hypothetical protein ACSMXN_09365 [Jatrophihabitans sp. DSM 45814]